MTTEVIKRQTAIKLRIGDILSGKPILDESPEFQNPRFKFLELGNRKITRVNLVANIVDRYSSEGEKKYLNLTIDDASGQIKLKVFGEDVARFESFLQGHTVIVVGTLRFYNNEVYLNPELIRQVDPRYLLVRKLELDADLPKQVNKEEITAIKDQIIEKIKLAEEQGGIEIEKLILELKASPDLINQEVHKMLEEGLAYEPRPGKIRYLG